MQFGKNIKMIDKHFIPINVSNSEVNDIIKAIEKNVKWINEEAINKDTDYMLFRINNGIFESKN